MKRITFTPTEAQAKFLSLYQKVQGVDNPQDILSLALDKLEQEQKSALYDKLDELMSGADVAAQSTASVSPPFSSSPASASGSPDEGND